jgi:hypothetical protein
MGRKTRRDLTNTQHHPRQTCVKPDQPRNHNRGQLHNPLYKHQEPKGPTLDKHPQTNNQRTTLQRTTRTLTTRTDGPRPQGPHLTNDTTRQTSRPPQGPHEGSTTTPTRAESNPRQTPKKHQNYKKGPRTKKGPKKGPGTGPKKDRDGAKKGGFRLLRTK